MGELLRFRRLYREVTSLHALALLPAVPTRAQLPPGYVDPKPVLAAVEKAAGADKLRCVTVSGTAYAGIVGQQRESAWNVD